MGRQLKSLTRERQFCCNHRRQ